MAESRLAGLAGRMKALIEAEEKRRNAEAAEQERAAAARRELEARLEKKRAAGRAARAALLDDVEAFCATIGHLRAAREEGAVRLEYRGRTVILEPEGDDDRIAIRLDDEVVPRNHHMARDGEEWEVVFDHGTSTVRFDLEEGLTQILREHLWVPLPKGRIEVDDVVVAPEPAPVVEAAPAAAPAPIAEPEVAAPASEPEPEAASDAKSKTRRSKATKAPPGSEVKELKGRLA